MILIITRSLSLIGAFSKSTIAWAARIDHTVDMLQAYIGIKYPGAIHLRRYGDASAARAGNSQIREAPVKNKLMFLFYEFTNAYLSV